MTPEIGGTLYVVPTPLGPSSQDFVTPKGVAEVIRGLDGFIAESAKSARAFLKLIDPARPLRDTAIAELNAHTPAASIDALLDPLRRGHRIGLLSDAGCPAVADPGASLVERAHRERIVVVPLVGPSAILLALMASGLEGQRFAFHGYLPVEPMAREQALRSAESDSAAQCSAQLFIETPYRNNQLLAAILRVCRATTRLCLATDLTLPSETIRTMPLRLWQVQTPDLDRRPTVFVLQA